MPIRDVHLDGEGPAYAQVYRALRGSILAGRATSGDRLPATRLLARELGVSRTTILAAYDQLLAEGYVVARVGSGTFVAPQLPESKAAKLRRQAAPPVASDTPLRLSRFGERLRAHRPRRLYQRLEERTPPDFDFVHSVPDVHGLPTDAWRRIASRRALHTPADHLSYGTPAGLRELRVALAAYLARARAIDARPEQIVLCSGVAQALDLAARLFIDEGDGVVLEEPHYVGARRSFLAAGARITGVPVDEDGLDTARLPAPIPGQHKLAYVTPSHQFPMGSILSLRRRLALLDWAQRADAFLIEDDYDSEFRYSGRSIESLKSLDTRSRVIYVGTFSKTLFPALRSGYAVLPETLVERFLDAKWLADWSSPYLVHEALADFVARGEYERHLRRARTLYGNRRKTLIDGLSSILGGRVRFRDTQAGLHVLVAVPGVAATRTRALIGRALERGVGIYPSASHYLAPPPHVELIMGFTQVDEIGIREGLGRLGGVIDEFAS
jgi:GntR family transcriptional regulator/MocR family aminotransferase